MGKTEQESLKKLPDLAQELGGRFRGVGLQCHVRELEAQTAASRFLEDCLALIHELQLERGTRFVSADSQRALNLGSLKEISQRSACAREAILKSAEELGPWSDVLGARALISMACALESLSNLDAVREEPAGLLEADAIFREFTLCIESILRAGYSVSTTSLPTTAAYLAALYHISCAKESAGKERAHLAAALARDRIEPGTKDAICGLIQDQELALATADGLLPPGAAPLVDRERTSQALEKFRRVALSPGSRDSGISLNAATWFEKATSHMDVLRREEAMLCHLFHGELAEAGQTARRHCEQAGSSPPSPDHQPLAFLVPETTAAGSFRLASPQPELARPLLKLLADSTARIQAMEQELLAAREALEERKVIERAKGILMLHHGLDEKKAYEILRSEAMRRTVKICEIASDLIRSESLWVKSGSDRQRITK